MKMRLRANFKGNGMMHHDRKNGLSLSPQMPRRHGVPGIVHKPGGASQRHSTFKSCFCHAIRSNQALRSSGSTSHTHTNTLVGYVEHFQAERCTINNSQTMVLKEMVRPSTGFCRNMQWTMLREPWAKPDMVILLNQSLWNLGKILRFPIVIQIPDQRCQLDM